MGYLKMTSGRKFVAFNGALGHRRGQVWLLCRAWFAVFLPLAVMPRLAIRNSECLMGIASIRCNPYISGSPWPTRKQTFRYIHQLWLNLAQLKLTGGVWQYKRAYLE
jgi:hypothetical protein